MAPEHWFVIALSVAALLVGIGLFKANSHDLGHADWVWFPAACQADLREVCRIACTVEPGTDCASGCELIHATVPLEDLSIRPRRCFPGGMWRPS